MNVKDTIQIRRALRALAPLDVTEDLIYELGKSAQLAPSCGNKQPWRYVFVYEPTTLTELHAALSGGNYWAKKASLIIVVCGKKENDCVLGDREYYLFDMGLATGFLLLRATEMGLVTHPMAGFNPKIAKKVLRIPENVMVITLIAVGNKTDNIKGLSQKHAEQEKKRPARLSLDEIIFKNSYGDR